MSTFADKILTGQCPDTEDWNQHLIESHKVAPSQTPAAFAPYLTRDGRTSYDLLAQCVADLHRTESKVLDLACGDGHLFPLLLKSLGQKGKIIGIDMSEEELEVARKNYGRNERIQLHRAKAQSLPLIDSSIDAIVCHMAFMLMLPIGPAISEIARVLKPGGSFNAVIGNSRGKGGLFGEIQKISSQFLDSHYPKFREAQSGDSRVQSDAGIRELFSRDLGFQEGVDFSEFALSVKTNSQGVWDFMKNMYFISMLPPPEKNQLRIQLEDFATDNMGVDGTVSFEFSMKMFTAKKL